MNLMPLFEQAWSALLVALDSFTFQIALEAFLTWLTPKHVLEAASAALGVGGAYLLAVKSPKAGWAFVLWLFSNIGWIVFGWINAHWFLVLQNIAFAITSLIGIWIWFSAELVGGALADDGLGDE